MSIALPDDPGPADANPFYLDWGGVLRSPLGGADQKLNRLGDRFGIEVTLPPLEHVGAGQAWVADLISAQRDGALYPWPQLDFDPGTPGTPRVNGADQEGMLLSVDGLTPGYTFRKGQFLSVIHGGRRYLHIMRQPAIANPSGQVTLPIGPMMRTAYADNAIVEVARPMIEGFLEGNRRDWNLSVARTVGLTFTIVEAE